MIGRILSHRASQNHTSSFKQDRAYGQWLQYGVNFLFNTNLPFNQITNRRQKWTEKVLYPLHTVWISIGNVDAM